MAGQRGQVSTPYYTPAQTPLSPAMGAAPPSATASVLPAGHAPGGKAKRRRVATFWHSASKTLKGQFFVLATVGALLALVLALFTSQSVGRASLDLDTVASGSIPSVDAAQALGQYIDDIDAKAADYLATAALTSSEPCSLVGPHNTTRDLGTKTVHDCDKLNIDAEIILTNQQLFNAAHNVTYPGESTAVQRITAGFEEYVGYMTVMEHEFDQVANKSDNNDPHFKAAYDAYRAASTVLHTHIQRQPNLDESALPTCTIGVDGHTASPNQWVYGGIDDNIDCLSNINYTHLQGAYSDMQGFLGLTITFCIVLCLLFCALLIFTTLRMALITHRVINVGLSLALLAGIVFSLTVVNLFTGLAGDHGAFGQMVRDDYDSVFYADQLKRYGTNANADESRWLVALAFKDSENANHWVTDWQTNTKQVERLIVRADSNRTWPEENQPVIDMQYNWHTYTDIDGQIRQKAQAGDLLAAEQLSTGKSNEAFGNFSNAVDALSKANYNHYYDTWHTTQSALNTYILLCALFFPLSGLLAVWGISRRLRDF